MVLYGLEINPVSGPLREEAWTSIHMQHQSRNLEDVAAHHAEMQRWCCDNLGRYGQNWIVQSQGIGAMAGHFHVHIEGGTRTAAFLLRFRTEVAEAWES